MKKPTPKNSVYDPNPSESPDYTLSIRVGREQFLDVKASIRRILKQIYNPCPMGLVKKIESDLTRYPTQYAIVYTGSRSICALGEADFKTLVGVETRIEFITNQG